MNTKDNNTYAEILSVYEKRSTCMRVKVACVAVRDGRSVCSGWNGSASDQHHCSDVMGTVEYQQLSPEEFKSVHREFSIDNEIHAEMNMVAYAAKHGISLNGTDIYISYSPCGDCAKVLQAVGIKRVFYKQMYDRDPTGKFVEYLRNRGIEVKQLRS